ncbi:MAG TPA: multifunctional oxoglutarate decarboxylase/oxoglutarate dehydrogenase thiamine pyrophosphate-binding subunit/dihydrolipoyllysine-residue succinyltransferase subunit [Gemmatimonadales bacterium]|nr:multifunctional oxoglutarate decarboxylase/oxoglutarate dehydrogenase thiamine pyrophosphate-binding subunit/dihydrolipoyllysine-residue succinyltransferase subunit [Gemmatimonadales bacterium]
MSEFVFGTNNAAFVQVMYEQYLRDPTSVGEEWRALFDNGHLSELPVIPTDRAEVLRETGSGKREAGSGNPPGTTLPTSPLPLPPGATPMTGPAARLVQNMTESLSVPTATSFRDIAVDVLDARRKTLNAQLAPKNRKVSFTHLIGWAIVQAAREFPVMTHSFHEYEGKPHRLDPQNVSLGLAVDVEKKDGTRALVVPVIKHAEQMDFATFYATYESLVEKARTNKLMPDDFAGGSITLTNPGTIGTIASVPRLMKGQGSIIATGGIRSIGPAKVMTITSTYDHRVIQGAESGMFLRLLDSLLQGEEDFYGKVMAAAGAIGSGKREEGSVVPAGSALPASPLPLPARGNPSVDDLRHVAAAMSLVKAYRNFGHLAARLDPLGAPPRGDPALDTGPLGLTPEVLASIPTEVLRIYVSGATLAEALPQLKATYCGTIAYEVEHIASHEQRLWLRHVIESGEHTKPLTPDQQKQLLNHLTRVDALERFLQRAYLGQKRFSIEGVDITVPMLELINELAAHAGARKVVMGMAHRGRLNVLAHIVGMPYEAILEEFEGGPAGDEADPDAVTGDVKYHLGADGDFTLPSGKSIRVILLPNPSHLEAVNPVVEGRARAEQTDRSGTEATTNGEAAIPILLHGDAAFAGQGVVAETFNLARLSGYATGGTIHLITNNQIGFTTLPQEGRSTDYSSDLAKGFDVPIIHVNADDPEACLAAVRLAWMYREKFHGDVVIDVVGYRRHGHNEGDEPAYTQPLMYERIKQTPTVREKYAAVLVERGIITAEQAKAEADAAYQKLDAVKQGLAAATAKKHGDDRLSRSTSGEPETAVAADVLTTLNSALLDVPSDFTIHPKLKRQLERRRETIAKGGMEWAQAEALAFGSLLVEGTPIRLTGQDTERGTFAQRHLMLHDPANDRRWAPIQHLREARAPFELHNSPLSEAACLGFEYGYAVAAPDALVLWEAQYGDFANGAEVIVDQFLVAGLAKWGQTSRLTMLLPHGYEGGGPAHSSARLERYLSLGAEGNIRVANPTTPAQYFHLLRRQARHSEVRPLVVMTPKSLLRLPAATSSLAELTSGSFQPVLDDADAANRRDQVTRLVLCSGKIYYDLLAAPARAGAAHVAVGRVELLYPFPAEGVAALAKKYPKLTEVMWIQEEPRNMGARKFVLPKLRDTLTSLTVRDVSRPERSSPAEGYPGPHKVEQDRIVAQAFQ